MRCLLLLYSVRLFKTGDTYLLVHVKYKRGVKCRHDSFGGIIFFLLRRVNDFLDIIVSPTRCMRIISTVVLVYLLYSV